MRIVRIFFEKMGESAYISHLDLQRVMSRALRKSGIPVWYSQGFNPHIYMSFSLPLPLAQQSLCESVDVKTESEEDLSVYKDALNSALPRGIRVLDIAPPVYTADKITQCKYEITYPQTQDVKSAIIGYNAAESAVVCRKTKRSEQDFDLKSVLYEIGDEMLVQGTNGICVRLPAGGNININPVLLAGFLSENFGLDAKMASIIRMEIWAGSEKYT